MINRVKALFTSTPATQIRTFAILCGMTVAALLVHGYHPCAEDAAIYVPGIEKLLHPKLFPFGSEFFLSHAQMTLFPEFVAWPMKLAHIGMDEGLFIWYLFSIFLLLSACWSLSRHLFADDVVCWTGVALVAALLTIPAAGTSLLLADPYLTPRSFSTSTVLFALSATLGRRYFSAAIWLLITGVFHPLMVVYGTLLCGMLALFQTGLPRRAWERIRDQSGVEPAFELKVLVFPFCAALVFPGFHPASGAYLEALQTRGYFFVKNWAWYEWIGAIAPLVILLLVARFVPKTSLQSLRHLCYSSVSCGVLLTIVALILSASPQFESLAELQPMRVFHPIYLVFFLVLGGTLATTLRGKPARCLLLFAPVCLAMFFVQRATFPGNRHVEWPGIAPTGRWLQAFAWIRTNTPESAVFALNPNHMHLPDEDNQGFRALAQRSMLADNSKDTGVVTMFPALAATWKQQVVAQQDWEDFRLADFQGLAHNYGVSWVVLDTADSKGLECPYDRESIQVCKVAPALPQLTNLRVTEGQY